MHLVENIHLPYIIKVVCKISLVTISFRIFKMIRLCSLGAHDWANKVVSFTSNSLL